MLWADPHELTRAMNNLLSNAVKYAPENSEVIISARPTNDEQLIISVFDHAADGFELAILLPIQPRGK